MFMGFKNDTMMLVEALPVANRPTWLKVPPYGTLICPPQRKQAFRFADTAWSLAFGTVDDRNPALP